MEKGCTLCPRLCGADRRGGARGFCGAPAAMEVGAVCVHRGEEPPLVPIVNVFFSHCNLHCIYCQNWQISGGERLKAKGERYSVDELADIIVSHLSHLTSTPSPLTSNLSPFTSNLSPFTSNLSPFTSNLAPMVGFVTAAHYADRLPEIVEAIHSRGFNPTVVYNSSGYESVDRLRKLEGLVDIYLPDLKYMDRDLARAYSHAADYPDVAASAIAEMRRQVGGGLAVDPDSGRALHGIIVRHLVLPGAVGNSIACLEWLADHFNPFSLHLSLMAQYFPPQAGLPSPLDRTLTAGEYAAVTAHAEKLGLTAGWTQELCAESHYRPDFSNQEIPFGQ